MEKYHPWAGAALILAATLGSLGPILGKFALWQFEPLFIVTLRFGLALMILIPLAVFSKNIQIKKQDAFLIMSISLLGAGNFVFFTVGLEFTTAIMTQISYLLTPVLVLALSSIFLKLKPTYKQIIGVLLGILGAGLVLTKTFLDQSGFTGQSLGSFKGNLIILLAVFSWSVYLILSKKASRQYSALILTTATAITTFFLSLVFVIKDSQIHWQALINAGAINILSVIGLALVNSVLMLFLYQWGNKHGTAFAAASVVYFSVLATAVMAIPLFGEKLSFFLLICAGLIFTSVYLTVVQPAYRKMKNQKAKQ